MKKLLFLALCLLPLSVFAETDVYIGLTSKNTAAALPSLGFARFNYLDESLASSAEELHSVMRYDLMFSRHFDINENGPAVDFKNLKQSFEKWAKLGAEYVLFANVLKEEEGKIVFNIYVYHLESGKSALARSYKGGADAMRRTAHLAADQVVLALTGKRGIADTKIAYSAEVMNGKKRNKEIFIVDYDGHGARKITTDRSMSILPRWSKDGHIYYTSYRFGTPDIFKINLAKGKVENVSVSKGLDLVGGVSPDGRSIVLTKSASSNTIISEYNLETGVSRPLTNQEGVDGSPSYSPDGRFVVFVSNRSGNPQIYRLERATGETKRLTNSFNWADTPQWSPTGEWIVFAGRLANNHPIDIFLVDITGTNIKQLTADAGKNEDPAWSPDGRFIAFTTTRGGKRQLYVMDNDGSAPHLIADIAQGQLFTPAWSF